MIGPASPCWRAPAWRLPRCSPGRACASTRRRTLWRASQFPASRAVSLPPRPVGEQAERAGAAAPEWPVPVGPALGGRAPAGSSDGAEGRAGPAGSSVTPRRGRSRSRLLVGGICSSQCGRGCRRVRRSDGVVRDSPVSVVAFGCTAALASRRAREAAPCRWGSLAVGTRHKQGAIEVAAAARVRGSGSRPLRE